MTMTPPTTPNHPTSHLHHRPASPSHSNNNVKLSRGLRSTTKLSIWTILVVAITATTMNMFTLQCQQQGDNLDELTTRVMMRMSESQQHREALLHMGVPVQVNHKDQKIRASPKEEVINVKEISPPKEHQEEVLDARERIVKFKENAAAALNKNSPTRKTPPPKKTTANTLKANALKPATDHIIKNPPTTKQPPAAAAKNIKATTNRPIVKPAAGDPVKNHKGTGSITATHTNYSKHTTNPIKKGTTPPTKVGATAKVNALKPATNLDKNPPAKTAVPARPTKVNTLKPITNLDKSHNKQTTKTTDDMYIPLTTTNLWEDSKLIPQWLKDYFVWHQEQLTLLTPDNWEEKRFLISNARRHIKSGGMTDRIRPIPAILRLAAQTKRIFLLSWGKPFRMEEFLLPPQGGLDWRVPDYMLKNVTNSANVWANWTGTVETAHREKDWNFFNFRYQSWNYGELWYDNHTLEGEASAHHVFRDIWRVVFTPSPPVAQRIQQNFEELDLVPGEFATAHIRALYGRTREVDRTPEKIQRMAHNAMNCASRLRPGGPFFVASDSAVAAQSAVEYGRSHGVKVEVANHPKEPMHVDYHNESDTSITPADFYDGFVDLYLMAGTRCVAVGPGGFARWGNLLGYNDTCVIHHFARKAEKCDWTDKRVEGKAPIGYVSEEERQLEASKIRDIPKFHAPMP